MPFRNLIATALALGALAAPAAARAFGGGGELDEYDGGVVIVAGKTLTLDERTRIEDAGGRRLSRDALDARVGGYVRFEAERGVPHPRATRIVIEDEIEDPGETR